MLMRNDRGELISCCAKALQGPNNSKKAEAIVTREALSWLPHQRLSHVMIRTDAKIACNAILVDANPIACCFEIYQLLWIIPRIFKHDLK